MKKMMLAVALLCGLATPALAVPPCWPGNVVNVGPGQYRSPAQLSAWWTTYGLPAGHPAPHNYVAFHVSDQSCKAAYGSSAWAQITGPYTLTNMVNAYTISQGVWFQCKKCSGIGTIDPTPIDPPIDY